jgi:hypothetical protein
MDTWEYGTAYLDVQKDQVVSTQGPLPRVECDNLLNYLMRAGSIGWELFTIVPLGVDMRLFFKKRRTGEE